MKRTIISIIVAGLFAGIGGTAVAQNVTAGEQPAAAPEAKAQGKADYTAAKDKAQMEYKDAKAKCGSLKGDAMRSCMSDAKAAHTQALAEAKTQWETKGSAKEGQADPSTSPSKGPKSDTRSAVEVEPVMQKASDRSGQPSANEPAVDKTSVMSGTNESADRGGQPAPGEGTAATETIKSGTNEPSDRSGQPATAEGAGATDTIKVEKTTAHEAAHSGYKAAALKCDSLQGTARRSCMTVAERERTDALAAADRKKAEPGSTTEKTRDDRSDADSENYRNVSTARKAVDGGNATKGNAK